MTVYVIVGWGGVVRVFDSYPRARHWVENSNDPTEYTITKHEVLQ